MATVRKTNTLTDAQDDWIKAQVASGDYTHDSEYLRDLIRREQEKADAEARYRASNG
jgi:antitoxin ParD1/3/4